MADFAIRESLGIELVAERYHDKRRDRTGDDAYHDHASKLGLVLQELWIAFDNYAPSSPTFRLNQRRTEH